MKSSFKYLNFLVFQFMNYVKMIQGRRGEVRVSTDFLSRKESIYFLFLERNKTEGYKGVRK